MSGVSAETAPVVIVGAGCIGASIAYHLGVRGVKGVVVLERELFAGAGSTAKAAGGIRAQFSNPLNVKLSLLSIAFYERFEEALGSESEFEQVGYLFVLTDPERWSVFQAQAAMQRDLGVPVRTLTPAEAREIVPQMNVDDVLGATFGEKDGLADPHLVTQGFVSAARRLGARFEFSRPARGFVMDGRRVTGVTTDTGTISTPVVIDAAGPWAAEVARWAGVDLPVAPIRRHCFTTEPMAWVGERLPMVVDMKSGVYMHREGGGILMGLANRDEAPGFDTSVNWDLLERVVEPAMHRIPALEAAEVSNAWAGLYETTPDHNAVLGPPEGTEGFLLANGFSGHGLMHAPAVGQMISEWIVDGRPSLDLSPLRLERFAAADVSAEANVI